MLLIKNGRVLDPSSNTDAALDVLVDGPRISKVGASLSASNAEVFDAAGMIVAPGFIDLHCHLREPGQELSETIETGTRAAARGGFTAVCTMPNTQPIYDNASVTRGIVERAAAAGAVRVWPIGAASVGSKAEALAEIAAMKDAGIVAVSDDGKPVATARLMRQVMDYCRALDLPVIDHCEDPSLFACGVMREGPRSIRLGLKGIPAQNESAARFARRSRRAHRRPGRRQRGRHRHRPRAASPFEQGRRIRPRSLWNHRFRNGSRTGPERAPASGENFAQAFSRIVYYRTGTCPRHRTKNCRR